MPIQSTDTTSTITFSASNQSWTIKSGVVVASDIGVAVEMGATGGTLLNYGALSGNNDNGVEVSGGAGYDFIFNEAGASIAGSNGVIDFASNDVIHNLGTIEGTGQFGILATGSAVNIYNGGYVFGGSNAIAIESTGAVTIDNSGTVEGGSVAIDLIDNSAAATVVRNSGSLTGYSEAILANSYSTLYLSNSGAIHGTILLNSGSDSIVNSGTIDGDIYLGNGSNSFSETGGSVSGAINGGGGSDAFSFDMASFAAGVTLNAGAGVDFLQFSTSGTLTADAFNYVSGIEQIALAKGSNAIALNDDLVRSAKNHTLTVSGNSGADTIDASAVFSATDKVRIVGNGGADTLIAGGGADTFIYGAASNSSSTHYDTVSGMNFASDRFNIPGSVSAIDAAVSTGTLSSASFDANLGAALSGHLLAHDAILFNPNAGTLSGQTFLVVDLNGTAGYQANADLVIHLAGQTGTLTTGDFI